MRTDAFLDFLQTRFQSRSQKPLSLQAAQDVISRCKRVEKAFGVDLDGLTPVEIEAIEHRVRVESDRFGFTGRVDRARRDVIGAVRYYAVFRSH